MAIRHYKGEIGEFDYDDKEFKLNNGNGFVITIEWVEYLEYIGNETDGRKIKIPDGIKTCEKL